MYLGIEPIKHVQGLRRIVCVIPFHILKVSINQRSRRFLAAAFFVFYFVGLVWMGVRAYAEMHKPKEKIN